MSSGAITFFFVNGPTKRIVVPDADTRKHILNSIADGHNVNVMADDGMLVVVARNVTFIEASA